MKQSLRLAPLAGTVALALATPASADVPMSDFERDMRMAFENDGEPMELALLSEKEMRETKGAVWPFKIAWIGRFFWGSSWGQILSGYDLYHHNNYSDLRTFYQWSGTQSMTFGLLNAVTANPIVQGSLNVLGTIGLSELRQVLNRNNWSVIDAINHANSAIAASIARHVGGGTQPEPMSASSRASGYLVSLLATINQDRLRQFLSDIPRKAFDETLTRIESDISRDDFLRDLPTEIVNTFLTAMPEDHVPDFREIVPSHIMNGLNAAIASQPQAQHMAHNPSAHWRR